MRLLLDENLSPKILPALRALRRQLDAQSIYHWRAGEFVAADGERILEAAAKENRVLVTLDISTIPPLLRRWQEEGRHHKGVIFLSQRYPGNAIGRISRSLAALDAEHGSENWTDRVIFLP